MTEYIASRRIRVRENVEKEQCWYTHYVDVTIKADNREAFLLIDKFLEDHKEWRLNEDCC